MYIDTVIKNIGQLITMDGPKRPWLKEDISKLEKIENGCIVIKNGKIYETGTNEILKKYEKRKDIEIIDAEGKLVTPGLIDPHVHLIFYGWREKELELKLKGKSYIEILEAGGGILSTVESTREASKDELFDFVWKAMDRMLVHGTTTAEAKSGYGLDMDTELKSLELIEELGIKHPIDLIPTYLGAHAVPKEFENDTEGYVDFIVEEVLPEVSKRNLAEFCDVFCEEGVFTVDQSRRILNEAKKLGMKPKIHSDELVSSGGGELAAEVEAVTAEHLLKVSDEGIKEMAEKGVIGVLLPGTPFYLMLEDYANARKMIDMGLPVALATDFNPGTSATESLQMIMNLASYNMKMTPEEIITAVTINAAYAVDRGDEIGSLEPGKKADLVIWDSPNLEFLMYHFGVNLADKVFKGGRLVVDGGVRI